VFQWQDEPLDLLLICLGVAATILIGSIAFSLFYVEQPKVDQTGP
jgi:hypothetical protein